MTDIFFQLLSVALDKQVALSRTVTETEWAELLEMSLKQTLAGVMFAGIERLPSEQRPPKEILLRWYAFAENIKESTAYHQPLTSHLSPLTSVLLRYWTP